MGSTASKEETETKQLEPEQTPAAAQQVEEDDEPDDWDKRIFSTGCAEENTKLTDCYYEKKDWRLCKEEMERFRKCWKAQGNDQRTDTKDT
ncbi:CHCH domain-containing protein [Cercophora newfieldiana]|uniref:CHCH domain-containing protein n=1 Tax=Cercophora newfieldiana TaxID=92897 RepID=A0AA39Y254_9PEZI|nr:CHCH domain-containing protein [Cercophora newfieldiana]